MSKFSQSDATRLSELLGKELEIFGQIHKQTEKQSKLLAKDDIEAFDSSLDKRQELIEKINGLHQESDPLMQSYMSSPEGGKNKEIEKLREQIRETIVICTELDEKSAADIKDKTEEHTDKIDKLSASRKGLEGYAQSVPNTPELFDKKT